MFIYVAGGWAGHFLFLEQTGSAVSIGDTIWFESPGGTLQAIYLKFLVSSLIVPWPSVLDLATLEK